MHDSNIDVLRIAEPEIRYNENIVDVNYKIEVTEKANNQTSVFNEKHSMRYLFLPELKKILEDLNIEIMDSLTWMSDDELNLNSWQGVVVASKKV